MDEIEERMENMEMSMEAANEILIEKLNEFEDRVSVLENKQDSDLKQFLKELEELSDSMPVQTSSPILGFGKGGSPDSCRIEGSTDIRFVIFTYVSN
jgi:CRISPR/Cas system CMR subunit Cmr6 (Cas7 group RAMP superfamily)